jgi:hypothetical protein
MIEWGVFLAGLGIFLYGLSELLLVRFDNEDDNK